MDDWTGYVPPAGKPDNGPVWLALGFMLGWLFLLTVAVLSRS